MCGIGGYLGAEVDPRHGAGVVEQMISTIAHRGPDDSGCWIDERGRVGLGNRRLAIVDLTPDGHQPMSSAEGRYVVTYNGEIYNHEPLREDLTRLGHGFRGHSDTEVLLAAVTEWGVAASLKKFVGMFAFALWDRHDETLWLARDRIGEKPLYHGWFGDTFLFGSELKCLRAHPAFRGEIDRDVLALYLSTSYVPGPNSIYRGVAKLPPGCFLQVRIRQGGTPSRPTSYWSATEAAEDGAANPLALSQGEAVDALDGLINDAVRQCMRADVPLGAFLSGGIDSSTVVAAMQSQSHEPVHTFTIGFDQHHMNEAPFAKRVASHLGTDHTELHVSEEDALRVVPRLATAYDEPLADASAIPTLLLAELTRRHVTVALSGDGGDELFGGYLHHRRMAGLWRRTRPVPVAARKALSRVLTRVAPETWDGLYRSACWILPPAARDRHPGPALHRLGEALSANEVETFCRSFLGHWRETGAVVIGAQARPPLTRPDQWSAVTDPIQRLMALDLVTFLPDDILVKVDRATMAASLEARAPFLDHRIVEFTWRLPMSLQLGDGHGKHLLRQVLYRHVPRELVDRPKMGFGAPVGDWLRGRLRDWADELLDASRLTQEGFLDPAPIVNRWREHRSGARDWSAPLWDVIMFEAWLESQRSPTESAV